MRTLTLAAVLALLAGPAVAQQQTFRNERGQITGSSSTGGNVTTFRDRSGRMTGTAERMRDGGVHVAVRQGLRFLRTELPRILATPCDALSPRMLRNATRLDRKQPRFR